MKKVVASSLICVIFLLITMISLLAFQRWKIKTAEPAQAHPLQSANSMHENKVTK